MLLLLGVVCAVLEFSVSVDMSLCVYVCLCNLIKAIDYLKQ